MKNLVVSLLVFSAVVFAQQQGAPIAGYKLLNTIKIPTGLAGNDISWVDASTARYYLANRGSGTSAPPTLDVINTQTGQFVTSIVLPSAGNGVVGIPRAHEVWVGLNDSTVAVINTDTNTVVKSISTGGTARADEVAYDPADDMVLIANDRDSPPFVSFIATRSYSVAKKLLYDGNQAPQSTGGLEQPVWDAVTNKFYLAVPATKANPNGEIDELDPETLSVTRSMPTACTGPSGLVLIPDQRLMTACGDVLDIATGKVVTTVKGVGGDEIWYNAGDQRVYFGGGTNRIGVSVVDGNTYELLTTLTVGQTVASPGVSQTTHSVAADAESNTVLVPVTGVGIQVWRNGAFIMAIPNPVAVAGSGDGTAIISWAAPNADTVEVHVGSPTGPVLSYGGNRGSQMTGPWVTDGTMFYLQDVSGGVPASTSNTAATTVVHLVRH
jgi:DNA-binding beta-propeller fold protein YncE